MAKIPVTTTSDTDNVIAVLNKLTKCPNSERSEAIERFHQRGGSAGHDLEDWLTPEKPVLEPNAK